MANPLMILLTKCGTFNADRNDSLAASQIAKADYVRLAMCQRIASNCLEHLPFACQSSKYMKITRNNAHFPRCY